MFDKLFFFAVAFAVAVAVNAVAVKPTFKILFIWAHIKVGRNFYQATKRERKTRDSLCLIDITSNVRTILCDDKYEKFAIFIPCTSGYVKSSICCTEKQRGNWENRMFTTK